MSKKFVL